MGWRLCLLDVVSLSAPRDFATRSFVASLPHSLEQSFFASRSMQFCGWPMAVVATITASCARQTRSSMWPWFQFLALLLALCSADSQFSGVKQVVALHLCQRAIAMV